MVPDRHGAEDTGARAASFATTHWSVVRTAGQPELPQAAEALEKLCRAYWYPLYGFVRRQGYTAPDAGDLTQAFFAHLLGRDFLRGVTKAKGHFRSFLLACLKHFLADGWERARTQRRGGGQPLLPLDTEGAESRYRLEPANAADPQAHYERQWALTVLDRVLNRLQEEFAAAGKARMFIRLEPFLVGEKSGQTYAELALSMGTSEAALKMTVHRMRQRYRQLFREEIAQTVAGPEEIEEEIRHLFFVIGR
ncbi:MAG: RNA polymerase sigma factor [Verrucomicrobiia bacterium]